MLTIDDFRGATDEEFLGMLGSLTEREQMVLLLRRGVNGNAPMSSEAVGSELGITGPEVQKIESKALETVERLNTGWREQRFVIIHKDGTREEF
ncbi:MAG: hypothetical protein IJ128_03830 [Firmicutes bacterium]|nr:hypothetical protein [Bacillota bacterium]